MLKKVYQLARLQETLVCVGTTAGEVMHKIRKAFATEQKELLTGIFEMDETYIKTSKSNLNEDDNNGFGDFNDDIPHLDNKPKNTSNTSAMIIEGFADGT